MYFLQKRCSNNVLFCSVKITKRMASTKQPELYNRTATPFLEEIIQFIATFGFVEDVVAMASVCHVHRAALAQALKTISISVIGWRQFAHENNRVYSLRCASIRAHIYPEVHGLLLTQSNPDGLTDLMNAVETIINTTAIPESFWADSVFADYYFVPEWQGITLQPVSDGLLLTVKNTNIQQLCPCFVCTAAAKYPECKAARHTDWACKAVRHLYLEGSEVPNLCAKCLALHWPCEFSYPRELRCIARDPGARCLFPDDTYPDRELGLLRMP